jgi:hypothetical protein
MVSPRPGDKIRRSFARLWRVMFSSGHLRPYFTASGSLIQLSLRYRCSEFSYSL